MVPKCLAKPYRSTPHYGEREKRRGLRRAVFWAEDQKRKDDREIAREKG